MPTARAVIPESGIYVGTDDGGIGYVLEVQNKTLSVVVMTYTPEGKQEYLLAAGPLREGRNLQGNDALRTPVHVFSGPLYRSVNGLPGDFMGSRPPEIGSFAIERAGSIALEFPVLNAVELAYLEIENPPFRRLRVYSDSLVRLPFGREAFGPQRRTGTFACWPDLRGDWVVIDQLDPALPPYRFNFSEVDVAQAELSSCNNAERRPHAVSFIDPGRQAVLRCFDEEGRPRPETGRVYWSGCELRLAGSSQPLFSMDAQDIGINRFVGSYGPIRPIREPIRPDGRLLGLRAE